MLEKKNNKLLIPLIIFLSIMFFIGIGVGTYKIAFNIFKERIEDKQKLKEKDDTLKGYNEDGEATATPLLYKVTKDDSDNTIYLFGSIHVADDRAYPMNKVIIDAYNNSDYLALEFDMVEYENDYTLQKKCLKYLVYDNGSTLKEHLSEETYNKLIDYLKKNNIYNSLYEEYKPAFFYSLLSSVFSLKSGLDSNLGIDMYFTKKARVDKKEILELESPELQYRLLGNSSDMLMDFIINSEIENETGNILGIKYLYENWLKGDAEALIGHSDDDIDEAKEVYGEYYNLINDFNYELVDKRNNKMSKLTDKYFQEGKNVFLVVGIAHIVGNNGIVSQLEELGYQVDIVEYHNSSSM